MPSIDKDATTAGINQSRQTGADIRRQADADRDHMLSVASQWGDLYHDVKHAIIHPVHGLAHARHAAHHRLADAYDGDNSGNGLANKDTNTMAMFDNEDGIQAARIAQVTDGLAPPTTTTPPEMQA